MIDLLCIGEALVVGRVGPQGVRDCLPLGVGGAELNVAIAARLGGHTVRYATRVGDDPFGALVIRELERAGVEAAVETDSFAPTGMYVRAERIVGRSAHYYRTGSAGSRLPDGETLRRSIREARHLHLTGVTAALSDENPAALRELMRYARSEGCRVSFDVNFRAKLWPVERAAPVLKQLADEADTVFVGADEADELWEADTFDDVRDLLSVPELVYKDGDRLRVGVSTDAGACWIPVTEATVVDSVGAGDAFAAGYLHVALDRSDDVDRRVQLGHAFACSVMATNSDVLDADGVARALSRVRR